MLVSFAKMQGLGNDFVVIDTISQPVYFNAAQIQKLSDRRFGIGFDQMLIVEPPKSPSVDFHYRIFNANGSEVGQCGNGARCFAKFVRFTGLTWKDKISVSTQEGNMAMKVHRDGNVTVEMRSPKFEPNAIPMRYAQAEKEYSLQVNGIRYRFGAVSMGNPHCVMLVDDIDIAPVAELGPAICEHSLFPEQVNVGFMQILSDDRIRLRVYERGVGETLACGSGACAAVAIGRIQERLKENVSVELPGGELMINWQGYDYPLYMTGAADFVFEGQLEL